MNRSDGSAPEPRQSDRGESLHPDPDDTPQPRSEEDLQPKDAGEMPLQPQDPVKPPDPAT